MYRRRAGTLRTKWLLSFWAIKNCPFIKNVLLREKVEVL